MVEFSLFSVLECPEGLRPEDTYNETLDLFTYAEELGFHAGWVAEHHFSDYGTLGSPAVFLSALAARTKKLRLGAAISVLPFHDPIRVAEDYAAVDVISRGRLNFGVGRGYQPLEFRGFGIDMAEARDRYLECLQIIIQAWSGQEVDFQGRYYDYKDRGISLRPLPVQDPVPLWVASVSPETFELVKDWGLGLLSGLLTNSSEQLIQKCPQYRASLPEGQRFRQTMPLMTPIYVGDTMEAAFNEFLPSAQWYWDTVGQLLPSAGDELPDSYSYFKKLGERTGAGAGDLTRTIARWPVGDADYVVDFLTDLCRQTTADEVICFASLGAMPHDMATQNVERIAQEIMPRVRANLANADEVRTNSTLATVLE